MKTCPLCGTSNQKDASFCQHCGKKFAQSYSKSDFERNMNDFGEEVEHIGKKIEASFERTGKQVETWYDQTFGILGPVISALIGFVILFIIINIFSFFGDTYQWMQKISTFLESLLLVFLLLFFLSSYSHYFSKKIKPFRFVSPLIGAIVFMVWFWVAINILAIIATQFDLALVHTFTDLFEALIFPLAILILLLGYIGVITSSKQEAESRAKSRNQSKNTAYEQKTSTYDDSKRLYRSGKDRMLGGVLGGLAEYLHVDPTIIRILYVLLLFASVGFVILAYFIGWILIPRNPNHQW
jgi:phage shock protein C